MKKLVVFSGAGISAESGLRTFRDDDDGLWNEFDIQEVASIEAWEQAPERVLAFHNEHRKLVRQALPNPAHHAIRSLERAFDVTVITQNIDDLHERAGSSNVIHLHGEILKARSSQNPNLRYDVALEGLSTNDKCELGSQLRPDVVWFGEDVPALDLAESFIRSADILIIVGTSLNVYPAASIIHLTSEYTRKYLIDPATRRLPPLKNLHFIRKKAGEGLPELAHQLLTQAGLPA